MIRLCDAEIYNVTISTVTRRTLLTQLWSMGGNLALAVIVLHDESGHCLGYVNYEMLLKNEQKELSDFMQTEFLKAEKHFFEEARRRFELNQDTSCLLVCNKENEIEYVVYDDVKKEYQVADRELKFLLNNYEAEQRVLDFREFYVNVQNVVIYGCNEWVYHFWKILKKWKIPVSIHGEKWKILGIMEDQSEQQYPDSTTFTIYAEGSDHTIVNKVIGGVRPDFNCVDTFAFLSDYHEAVCMQMVWDFLEKEHKMQAYVCLFPQQQEDESIAAYYRRNEKVRLEREKMIKPFMYKELEKCCGMVPEKYLEVKEQEDEQDKNSLKNKTGNSDTSAKRKIYIIGSCIVYGAYVWYEHSLIGQLRHLTENAKLPYEIVPLGITETDSRNLQQAIDLLTDSSENIVIFVGQKSMKYVTRGKRKIDLTLTEVFENAEENSPLYYDVPIHTTRYGNEIVAKEIYEKIIKPAIEKVSITEIGEMTNSFQLPIGMERQMQTYLEQIKQQCMLTVGIGTRGAIVMNCNPFTLGHQYLIEQARGQVDQLLIFVVEEDKSEFSFADRFEMVKRGVAGMDDVHVFPSGEFILSLHTMESYFAKESLQEEQIDASKDVNIFGKYIAPELNISVRFTGTEPIDKVTRQYNEEMAKTLKKYGVEYVEIPRRENDGEPISASNVRKYIKEKNWDKVEKLLPGSTIEYLRKNCVI